jgi:dipeptidyl aminopeptidase/acylaminoacyl peptidase
MHQETTMTNTSARRGRRGRLLFLLGGLVAVWALLSVSAVADDRERVAAPNYKAAAKYSNTFLRQFIYDTSVTPNWIGKTDTFWYSFRTSAGTSYYRVDPKSATKEPLFDRVKLGALLSEMLQKPLEPTALPLYQVNVNDEGTKLKFVTNDFQYEYDLQTEKLTKLGKAPAPPPPFPRREQPPDERELQDFGEEEDLDGTDDPQRGGRGQFGGGDYRSFSPDRSQYVYVWKHNLYLVEVKKEDPKKAGTAETGLGKPDEKKDPRGKPEDKKDENKSTPAAEPAKKEEPKAPDPDRDAIALTTDGNEDYTFGADRPTNTTNTTANTTTQERKTRPLVVWSKDSKGFSVLRRDIRGVQDLFLVNSLSTPRPTLEKYKYPMPGEDAIRKSELYVFNRDTKKLTRMAPRWKDERFSNPHWGKTFDELRFTRTDRPMRHAELCSLNPQTGETKCLLTERFESAHLTTQTPSYLDDSEEMIWWSERTGWGHFYLYERNGKLKNAITTGPWRAARVVEVDAKNRRLYFTGNARESGENLYHTHLYSVRLDGTGLTLLDPGSGNHSSVLSPTRQFLVDNCSAVDRAPVSVLRRADGEELMVLERADLSRLTEIGWKLPETFSVKAADGVTDLLGNLWKPFDFDPKKKYPIIAHVYPGPQQEGTTHTFTPAAGEQQLAQLGFIVIQVGHRGGTPNRSKAYASYGYYNLRDYGLEDKKAAIEQLAARHPYIDIDRVGIYGHSGGGFMTAAAMLQKPYNDFFKVGVSTSGNHDNNVYGDYWAEAYHGLKEVPIKDDKKDDKLRKDSIARPDEKEGTKGDVKKEGDRSEGTKEAEKPKTKYEIQVPTNAELAANLKGRLLLIHGDLDNNVHPAGTMRLVDALIKANKRFDMLIIPGKRHGYGDYQNYATQRMWEYFAQHLLGDCQPGADILEKAEPRSSGR